jgi:hypothetical protein
MQIAAQMKERVKEWLENPASITDMQLWLLKHGEFHYTDDLRRKVSELSAEMNADPAYHHVSNLPKRIAIIAGPLLTRHWHTIEAPQNCYFLMSDCPVFTFEMRDGRPYAGSGFGNENVVTMLPVSPSHIFVASPQNMAWASVATSQAVSHINHTIVQFAHRNVYSNVDSSEIQTLVDHELDRHVYGKTVYVPQRRLAG